MALIYVLEDDESIREIETFALENVGHQVVGFSHGKDFLTRVEKQRPDLCLVDLMLPDESGNSLVRKLRRNPETKKLPVIMVTAKTSELDLVKGIEDGADDYIKKPFSVMELISRVKALLRRTEAASEKEQKLDGLIINHEKHAVSVDGDELELTFKEFQLLSLLVANKGIVLTREKLMDKVWGTDFEGESRTIDAHIKTLRKKLGTYGDRIRTIRNVGYIIE